MIAVFLCIIVFLVSVNYASVAEWLLHRYVMHRPIGKSRLGRYPYEAHALTHHRIFRADETYHLKKEEDKWTIPMAWWNGPFLVATASIPWDITGLIFKSWLIPITAILTIAAYYGAYEYLHWCMHLPKARRIEKMRFFPWINGHHVLHHRYMSTNNFNVVWPFADWCFGTLLVRSKVPFCQPQGSFVRNVQPIVVNGRMKKLELPAWMNKVEIRKNDNHFSDTNRF